MLKKPIKILLLFFLFVICLILLSSLGFLLLNHAHTIDNIAKFIHSYWLYFALWRYFLMAVIIYFYPYFVRYLYADRKDINQVKTQKYSRRRYPLIVLVLTELLIVQNGLGWIVNKLIGM